MTKFLDKSFSSRPASREYRDNYDRTFGKAENDGTTPAPEGQIWVCGACGKTSKTRYGFDEKEQPVSSPGWDESCMLNAVLCFDRMQHGRHPIWEAVDQAEPTEPQALVNVVESAQVIQFTKPPHDDKCNCRLCRTARRAEGK